MRALLTACTRCETPYTEDNIIWSQGTRKCRKCHRDRERKRRHDKILLDPFISKKSKILKCLRLDAKKSYAQIATETGSTYGYVKDIANVMGLNRSSQHSVIPMKARILDILINDPQKSYYEVARELNCIYDYVKFIGRTSGLAKRKPGRRKKCGKKSTVPHNSTTLDPASIALTD